MKLKAIALAALSLTTSNLFAGDAGLGKGIYMSCVACHGANGEGVAAMKGPALANLSAKYIVAQEQNYKSKLRGAHPGNPSGMTMAAMAMTAATLEADQNLAAYIQTLPEPKPPATLTGGDPQKGKLLYSNCAACHNPDGKGNDLLNAPALAGQHDWYLLAQLEHFKSGVRGSDPKNTNAAVMRGMSGSLVDEQAMLDVIAYIQSL